MRLGLNLGYWNAGPADTIGIVKRAESLGFHSVWTAEAYGSDAVVPLTWVGAHTSTIHLGTAILQMPARTPANTAMTAATLDLLSGGRFLLGLGLSGPRSSRAGTASPTASPLRRRGSTSRSCARSCAANVPSSITGPTTTSPTRHPTPPAWASRSS